VIEQIHKGTSAQY